MQRSALVALLAFSLIACRSRGALAATLVAAVAAPLAVRRKGLALTAAGVLSVCLAVLVGTESLAQQVARGARDSRLGIWQNSLEMVPDFPVFGSGLNTFGTIFMRYQAVNRNEWVNAAHNDYLQALTDGGIVGLVIALALSVQLLGNALRGVRAGALEVGLLGSVLASCTHALVDFNWQIPAIAATFCLLAGLAAQARAGAARLDPPDTGT
jgi:O-antigen ligase